MYLFAIAAFFVVSFTVAAASVVAIFVWSRRRQAANANEEQPSTLAILKSDELSSIGIWHELLTRLDVVELLRTRIAQSGLNWTIGRVTLAMLLLATVGLALVWQIDFLPLWLALLVVPLAGLAPYFYIERTRQKRFLKFREVFPDALDSMARAMRSGSTVGGGLDVIATEAEAPVAGEIRQVLQELSIGASWDQALDDLTQRVPLSEVNLFVAALQVHSRTGGKLGDVMTHLSESMREQLALQGEIRSIAAHGKLTGLILTILPLGIAGMMMAVSPDYIGMLFTHPTGKHLIAAAAVCLVLAHLIIGRIVDIKT